MLKITKTVKCSMTGLQSKSTYCNGTKTAPVCKSHSPYTGRYCMCTHIRKSKKQHYWT